MSQPVVYARVTVTLEIECPGVWSQQTPLSDVQKQAVETALGILRGSLVIDHMTRGREGMQHAAAKVIGNPSVVAVLVNAGEVPR